MNRWEQLTGGVSGEQYAARFAELAERGQDVHGEARLCATLARPGARVLDAGCGTGRVLIQLAALGYDGVGVDQDASMLAVARRQAPGLTWVQADLSDFDPAAAGVASAFDLVVAAGNVFPLLAPGTEAAVAAALARALRPGGLLVAGFGLDREHLPVPPGLTLPEYDACCTTAGLTLTDRFATWDADPYEGGGYAVSVHRR
ncbi:class I SAM-dependent methyltransferase [Streptomyces ziwulingensis]